MQQGKLASLVLGVLAACSSNTADEPGRGQAALMGTVPSTSTMSPDDGWDFMLFEGVDGPATLAFGEFVDGEFVESFALQPFDFDADGEWDLVTNVNGAEAWVVNNPDLNSLTTEYMADGAPVSLDAATAVAALDSDCEAYLDDIGAPSPDIVSSILEGLDTEVFEIPSGLEDISVEGVDLAGIDGMTISVDAAAAVTNALLGLGICDLRPETAIGLCVDVVDTASSCTDSNCAIAVELAADGCLAALQGVASGSDACASELEASLGVDIAALEALADGV